MLAATRNTALRQARAQLRISNSCTVPHFGSYARLASSLAILEQRDGKLDPSSLTAIAAALKLGGSVVGFVAGTGTKAAAEQAAKVKGVEKVLYADSSAYDRVSEESWQFRTIYFLEMTI
jgi:electron transfer flavoprotein alpha subunit